MLDPFNSQECNAHLFVVILDLLLVSIFPELAQSGAKTDDGVLATATATNAGSSGRESSEHSKDPDDESNPWSFTRMRTPSLIDETTDFLS